MSGDSLAQESGYREPCYVEFAFRTWLNEPISDDTQERKETVTEEQSCAYPTVPATTGPGDDYPETSVVPVSGGDTFLDYPEIPIVPTSGAGDTLAQEDGFVEPCGADFALGTWANELISESSRDEKALRAHLECVEPPVPWTCEYTYFRDDFDDGVIGPEWDATFNVSEHDGVVEFFQDNDSEMHLTGKPRLDSNTSIEFGMKILAPQTAPIGTICLTQVANFQSSSGLYYKPSTDVQLWYRHPTTGLYTWNGVAWQSGWNIIAGFTFTIDEWYKIQVLSENDKWSYIITDSSNVIKVQTTPVLWTDIDDYPNLYWVLGYDGPGPSPDMEIDYFWICYDWAELIGTGPGPTAHTNSHWTGALDVYWDGSAWNSWFGETGITEVGTWVNGYRPTKMRMTYTDDDTFNLGLYDAVGNVIASDAAYVSGTELDITFVGNDIRFIAFTGSTANLVVTSIEFS